MKLTQETRDIIEDLRADIEFYKNRDIFSQKRKKYLEKLKSKVDKLYENIS